MTNVALVLSGGAGTRLWPMSNAARPKQFMRLFGDQSLYQLTLKRLMASGFDAIVAIANADHAALLESDAEEIGAPLDSILLEPARRDTAPAIAAGAAFALERYGPDARLLVSPCDHLISPVGAFADVMARGRAVADTGRLATFGIAPREASTQFGYVRQGAPLHALEQAFEAASFHEKPDIATAERFLASGDYLWNSGMFAFTPATFAREAEAHMPAIWANGSNAAAGARAEGRRLFLDADGFEACERISIDYALFERSASVGLVRAAFDWSDVGAWGAVKQALSERGNAVVGDATLRDVADSLVIGDGVPVVAIGVEGLAVVATREGVLVVPLERAAEIKAALEARSR